MIGICANCDKTVETDKHGNCSVCGSASVVIPKKVRRPRRRKSGKRTDSN